MLSLILGFIAPFIPDLIGLGKSYSEHKMELERLRLQGELADKEWKWKLESMEATADLAFSEAALKPTPSFGIQLLDAWTEKGWHFAWVAPVFYLFALADWVTTMMRPAITATVLWGYLAYKYGAILQMAAVSDPTFTTFEGVKATWTELDTDLVLMVIGFWFGARTRRRAQEGKGA